MREIKVTIVYRVPDWNTFHRALGDRLDKEYRNPEAVPGGAGHVLDWSVTPLAGGLDSIHCRRCSCERCECRCHH